MKITIPEMSLVLLVGASGSGKTTFARRHFRPTETIELDICRSMVADDETDTDAWEEATEALHYLAARRVARRHFTVVDAPNVKAKHRRPLIELARKHNFIPVAIALNLPERVCQARNTLFPERRVSAGLITDQVRQVGETLAVLKQEGFRHVYELRSSEEVEAVEIYRQALWADRTSDNGPFDIVGDIHGCYDELLALLEKLGYRLDGEKLQAPAGRKLVFLGDLVDRGPKIVKVLRLVMNAVDGGVALSVPGNHDDKVLRWLRGRDVEVKHGLAESIRQLNETTAEFREQVKSFLDTSVSHYVLDDGKLVVAHAGMKESLQGRGTAAVRAFALYGETSGETDEFGLPVRYPWANDYTGKAMVVYGHTPVTAPEWLNRTLNIDTGCVFGGKLSALRYPELEVVSVPAAKEYAAPVKR